MKSNQMKDKVVLITGGGSGIGLATAELLLSRGAKVAIVGRDKKKLEVACTQLKEVSSSVIFRECDVSAKNMVNEVVLDIEHELGVINCLANFAGVINVKNADGTMNDDIVFDVNVKGTMNTSNAVIERLIYHSAGGAIVNIASINAHTGNTDFPSYAASKGAILTFTKSFALKYGKKGIRMNSVSPGPVLTPMSYIEYPDYDKYIPEVSKAHPLGRIGNPNDIAQVVAFFLSDDAYWVTGQDLVVDGGYTLQE